jgi:hypothetical protein
MIVVIRSGEHRAPVLPRPWRPRRRGGMATPAAGWPSTSPEPRFPGEPPGVQSQPERNICPGGRHGHVPRAARHISAGPARPIRSGRTTSLRPSPPAASPSGARCAAPRTVGEEAAGGRAQRPAPDTIVVPERFFRKSQPQGRAWDTIFAAYSGPFRGVMNEQALLQDADATWRCCSGAPSSSPASVASPLPSSQLHHRTRHRPPPRS